MRGILKWLRRLSRGHRSTLVVNIASGPGPDPAAVAAMVDEKLRRRGG